MIRANKKGVIDVGPRSAHIAGLEYSVYSDLSGASDASIEFICPKPGDPDDYVAVRFASGERVTITNSCAANVLGLVNPEHFSHGDVESARKAIAALADYCGTTVEDIAGQIMERSYAKIEPIVLAFAEKYDIEKDHISLVGVGGGSASLIPYFSNKMGVKYSIPENAEVISSIGVALAMVRDVVERIIPDPKPADIRSIKTEAINKAVESGATPESVEVHIEIDNQTKKVTAIAMGSTEVKTTDLLKVCTEEEARTLACEDMSLPVDEVALMEKTDHFYVYGEKIHTDAGKKTPIRIMDTKGFIKVQRGNAMAKRAQAGNYEGVVKSLWDDMAVYKSEVIIRPEFYICIGARVLDFSTSEYEQLKLLIDIEMSTEDPGEEVLIVAANSRQT